MQAPNVLRKKHKVRSKFSFVGDVLIESILCLIAIATCVCIVYFGGV